MTVNIAEKYAALCAELKSAQETLSAAQANVRTLSAAVRAHQDLMSAQRRSKLPAPIAPSPIGDQARDQARDQVGDQASDQASAMDLPPPPTEDVVELLPPPTSRRRR